MFDIIILIVITVLIVYSAHIFCNALEHFGETLNISQGVTGSIFAAVGTALPETLIPIIAIIQMKFFGQNHADAISTSAILGAPLMLSTLSLFIMALFVINKRGIYDNVTPESTGIKRDLQFFIINYLLVLLSVLICSNTWAVIINNLIACILIINYIIYLMRTLKQSKHLVAHGHGTKASNNLILIDLITACTKYKVILNKYAKILKITWKFENIGTNNLQNKKQLSKFILIIMQLALAVIILICSASWFIVLIKSIAVNFHISTFILSLIIIPIATEMPEKINSIIWLHKRQDTLAVGNITGTLVFHAAILPAIGIIFTPWGIINHYESIVSIVIALIAGIWIYYHLCYQNNLKMIHFIANGLFYAVGLLMLYFCAT